MDPQLISTIRTTWAPVKELGLEEVGVLLFQNIFKQTPGAIDLFPFPNDPTNKRYRSHAKGVVETLDAAIGLLDNVVTLLPILIKLGSKHAKHYSVKVEHYPIVGAALMATLAEGLGDAFTEDVKKAWSDLYDIVTVTMIGDNYETNDDDDDDDDDSDDDADETPKPSSEEGQKRITTHVAVL